MVVKCISEATTCWEKMRHKTAAAALTKDRWPEMSQEGEARRQVDYSLAWKEEKRENPHCHRKVSQTAWAKPTEIDSFTVLEPGSPKLRCWECCVSSEGSRMKSPLSSFSLLMAPSVLGVLWLTVASLQSLPSSVHGLLWISLLVLFSFFEGTLVGFRANLNAGWCHLN